MKQIFWKLSGAGNDFICFDNRQGVIAPMLKTKLAVDLCRRGYSVGADGVLFIEPSQKADFTMRIFNGDGSEAETCGNASRCIARLALELGIAPARMSFETKSGVYRASVQNNYASVEMTDPDEMRLNIAFDEDWFSAEVLHSICIGVPHAVAFLKEESLKGINVFGMGRMLRHHPLFQPAGTNVNFARIMDRGNIEIRTYERGVEEETLACGTGCAATAVIAGHLGLADSPTRMHTQGGLINTIHYKIKDGKTTGLILEGDARIVYKGEIDIEI